MGRDIPQAPLRDRPTSWR